MISNEAVQRLIDCDRETLIALIALAMTGTSGMGPHWNSYHDPDIRMLMDTAQGTNTNPSPWQFLDGKWGKRP